MSGLRVSPQKILIVIDPAQTDAPIASALALAKAHDAALEAIICVEPVHDLSILARLAGVAPDQMLSDAVSRAKARGQDVLARIALGHDIPVTVRVGKAYLEIIHHVAETGCDFVIKTAEPLLGVDRFLYTSTDQHLLRKCPCAVWLQMPTTPTTRPTSGRVIAAVDVDISDADEPETLKELNRRVIDAACTIAGPKNKVIVLHAWDTVGEGVVWAFGNSGDARVAANRYVNEVLRLRQRAVKDLMDEVAADEAPRPRLVPKLVRGAAETVVRDQCHALGADVVVMGTVARTGLSGVFIGNTAENIINSLDCAILAVKPAGFISPLL